ncbi:MAG: zinc ribbon domain-containing protein [Ignavibacteria bacterium]
MPTYEYECGNCGHLFEIYQTMKDDKLTKCPVCEKETLKRLIGAGGGLIFKGSGFYLTDYKNKSTETSSGSGKDSKDTKDTKEAKDSKDGSVKTDTKKEPRSDSNTEKTETKASETTTKKTETKKTSDNKDQSKN